VRIQRSILLSAIAAMAIAAPSAALPGNGGNDPQGAKSQDQTDHQQVECNDDYIEYTGDPVMWPPNHKTQTYNVDAVDPDNDDATTSIFTVSNHDEYAEDGTEWNGAGNTDNDAQDAASSAEPATDADNDGRAETTVELRSERSGRGDGRTYTISATAEFDEGTCTAEFTVEVPHDMRSDKAPEAKDMDERGNGGS